VRLNGTTEMSPDFLLYPAIFIFSMLVIGLVYTVVEFTKMGSKEEKSKSDDK
jgi:hypothetical protein